MYLANLTVKGFRKVSSAEMSFRSGLNIILGENNAGKTAVIDGLRALLTTTEEGTLRLDETDLHLAADGTRATEILFSYVFKELTVVEEADFANALRPSATPGQYDAHFHIRYTINAAGRLRPKRWCGNHEDNPITVEMLDDLRAIYLPPLRDPASGLRPSRGSQLAKLLGRLASQEQKDEIVKIVRTFEEDLEKQKPVVDTQGAIVSQHSTMLGKELSQQLRVGLTPPDFQRIAARLQIAVDSFDVEQNGLGFNNLLYMAVVLSELETSPDAPYRALIIEEPEAHLHPQLQGVLLQFLQDKEPKKGDPAPVQIFVTSHSPNFASIADIDALCCIHQAPGGVRAFNPRSVKFEPSLKKDKLQRYLDITRAELFFARRVILVEGAAELFIVDALARKAGYDLKKSSVSLLSTEGLNFDCFLPLFGEKALNIRVAILTDADPPADTYPALTDALELSATAKILEASRSAWVQVYFAKKTLEYDLALHAENQVPMLNALKDIHPEIGRDLENAVAKVLADARPKELFKGMFNRDKGTDIQKGKYAQALAAAIAAEKGEIKIPPYIKDALDFVTKA